MKKIYLTLLYGMLSISLLKAQAFLSQNNTVLSIREGATLFVDGDVLIRGTAKIYNSDTLSFTGNFRNSSPHEGFDTVAHGMTRLLGDNQRIQGSSITTFHHLECLGSGIKTGELNVNVNGKLLLNSREFNIDRSTLTVRNQAIDAVQNSTGFVSAETPGGLARFTNTNAQYFYPLGSSSGLIIYRPAFFTPNDASFNIFKAALIGRNADVDGFNRSEKAAFICDIIPAYYYNFYQNIGSATADVTVTVDPVTDGNWNGISHRKVDAWIKTDSNTISSFGTLVTLTAPKQSDFVTPLFAPAFFSEPFGTLGNDTFIYLGSSIQLNTYGGSSYLWSPTQSLSCSDCPNPVASPQESTTYSVLTTAQNGCTYTDSIYVEVRKDIDQIDLQIPEVITPNADGYNDNWVIRSLEQFPDNDVAVFNRWGDRVYQKAPYDNSFNGRLWNMDLPEGTYYYVVKIKVSGEEKVFDGPLTIVK